jgi:protein TonB
MTRTSIIILLVTVLFFACQGPENTPDAGQILSADEHSAESGDNPESFVAYDTPPAPHGGFAAIQKNLLYPDEAKKAGIEGRVILNLCIDENGTIIDSKVIKTIDSNAEPANPKGDYGLSDAALQAVKSIEWEPASQEGKPVKVWVGIPVVFKLK